MTDTATPTVYPSGEVWYGETPEDGILAKFYGDPDLAARTARAVNHHDELVATLRFVAEHVTSEEGDEAVTEDNFGLPVAEVVKMAHDSMIHLARIVITNIAEGS